MRNQLKSLGKNEHKTKLKSLIEFYSWMLRECKIEESGAAHSRLKELKERLRSRTSILNKRDDIKRIYNYTINEEKSEK